VSASGERRKDALADFFNRADAFDLAVTRSKRVFGARPVGVVVHERTCLVAVDLQAMANGFFLVVITLNQWLARDVIFFRGLGRIELDMVAAAACGMDATSDSCAR